MSGAPDTMPVGTMSGTPQVLLAHHLKQLERFSINLGHIRMS